MVYAFNDQYRSLRQGRFISALILFLLIDALVFRTGFYYRYIKYAASAAGMYKLRMEQAPKQPEANQDLVGVIGDSRVAEGFSARIFDTNNASTQLKAVRLAMPGSTPRVWFYFLNHLDPNRNLFKAVVIPLTSYWDTDEWEDSTNRVEDLGYISPYATILEGFDDANTYDKFDCKMASILGSFNRLFSLSLDVRDFALHPVERLKDLKLTRHFNDYNYEGQSRRLSDLLRLPSSAVESEPEKKTILERLDARMNRTLPPQTGEKHRYVSLWMRRLIAAYATSDTSLIFIRVPTDALKRNVAINHEYSAINELGDRKNVIVAPENMFADLEQPEYFFDDMHLNSSGRVIFSTRLASFVKSSLKAKNRLATASQSAENR